MLYTSQAAGAVVPGPYALQLHRECLERRARMRAAVIRAPAPAPVLPPEIYPAHVFADDCDRGGEVSSPNRIREIQNLVCKSLRVCRADLLSARRERPLVIARQIAMYLCKRHTPNSSTDIGRRFGGRDHTTALHAARRVAKMMATPMGTSISPQWQPGACDFVRHAVNLAEVTISTWGEERIARLCNPGRAKA